MALPEARPTPPAAEHVDVAGLRLLRHEGEIWLILPGVARHQRLDAIEAARLAEELERLGQAAHHYAPGEIEDEEGAADVQTSAA